MRRVCVSVFFFFCGRSVLNFALQTEAGYCGVELDRLLEGAPKAFDFLTEGGFALRPQQASPVAFAGNVGCHPRLYFCLSLEEPGCAYRPCDAARRAHSTSLGYAALLFAFRSWHASRNRSIFSRRPKLKAVSFCVLCWQSCSRNPGVQVPTSDPSFSHAETESIVSSRMGIVWHHGSPW